MVVANHQLAAAFRHRNTSALQGYLGPGMVCKTGMKAKDFLYYIRRRFRGGAIIFRNTDASATPRAIFKVFTVIG